MTQLEKFSETTPVEQFDYSVVEPEDRELAQELARDGRQYIRRTNDDLKLLHDVLWAARPLFKYGTWTKWLKMELGIGQSWAYEIMHPRQPKGDVVGLIDAPEIIGTNDLSLDEEEQVEAGQQYLLPQEELQTIKDEGHLHIRRFGGNSEYYTPGSIASKVRAVLGTIDLDPCSCAKANEIVGAQRYYSLSEQHEDGLILPWQGSVFLNPPFNEKPSMRAWVERLVQTYRDGEVSEAIVLIPAYVQHALWFKPLYVFPRCMVYDRVYYETPTGQAERPPFATILVYLGDKPGLFYEQFQELGHVDGVNVSVVDAGQKRIPTEEEVREYNPFEEEEGDEPEQSESEPESRDWSIPAHVAQMWHESTPEGRAIAMKAMVGQFDGTKPEPQHRGGGGSRHVRKGEHTASSHVYTDIWGGGGKFTIEYPTPYGKAYSTFEAKTLEVAEETTKVATDVERNWRGFQQSTKTVGSTVKVL